VGFHSYTYNQTQYFFIEHEPKYILVSKTHLFDFHLVKQLALGQLLHGNGTTLLAMQLKITNQHKYLTPDIESRIVGSKKISPTNTSDTVALAIKCWMLLRYLGTHTPKITSNFPKQWTIEEIITSLFPYLQQFQLRRHEPSSKYACHKNYFILDGTCKVSFKVCSVDNCMKGVTFNKKKNFNCKEHKAYQSSDTPIYTG
jgi:hypothetical protein